MMLSVLVALVRIRAILLRRSGRSKSRMNKTEVPPELDCSEVTETSVHKNPINYFGKRDPDYEIFLLNLQQRVFFLKRGLAPQESARCRAIFCDMQFKDFIDRLIRGTNKLLNEEDIEILQSTGAKCAVVAVEYLERSKNFGLKGVDLHKLFLSSFVIAFKIHDDFEADVHWWSHLGGIDEKEINRTEVLICSRLDWKLSVSPKTFKSQREILLPHPIAFTEIALQ